MHGAVNFGSFRDQAAGIPGEATRMTIGRALLAAFLVAAPAGAQEIAAGRSLPRMLVRICPTLEDAKLDASTGLAGGKQDFREEFIAGERNEDCDFSPIEVTPLRRETAIASYRGWSITYDPQGNVTIPARFHLPETPIRIAERLQVISYWYARLKLMNGKEVEGWVELPERPYILEYLKASRP
jgi:hypothetical protein